MGEVKTRGDEVRASGNLPMRKAKGAPKKPLPKNAGDKLGLDWNENAQSSSIVTK